MSLRGTIARANKIPSIHHIAFKKVKGTPFVLYANYTSFLNGNRDVELQSFVERVRAFTGSVDHVSHCGACAHIGALKPEQLQLGPR